MDIINPLNILNLAKSIFEEKYIATTFKLECEIEYSKYIIGKCYKYFHCIFN